MAQGCRTARAAVKVCELLERGPAELEELELVAAEYDPDVHPYFWEF